MTLRNRIKRPSREDVEFCALTLCICLFAAVITFALIESGWGGAIVFLIKCTSRQ